MRHSFVPLRKQSKKAQRAYHAGQRGSWNGLSPVTRTVPSGRVYDRNRMKRRAGCDDGCLKGTGGTQRVPPVPFAILSHSIS